MKPIRITLSWPAKALSPNSRVHFMTLSTAKKAAKKEADWATRIALGRSVFTHEGKIPVRVTAYPPLAWRTGDEDNFQAQLKYHFDAIAKALGVNDRDFNQLGVTFAERKGSGSVVIEVGHGA